MDGAQCANNQEDTIMTTIDHLIQIATTKLKNATEKITKTGEQFSADPFEALLWGDGVVKAAADQLVWKRFLNAAKNTHHDPQTFCVEYVSNLMRTTMLAVMDGNNSSSPMANIMRSAESAARVSLIDELVSRGLVDHVLLR